MLEYEHSFIVNIVRSAGIFRTTANIGHGLYQSLQSSVQFSIISRLCWKVVRSVELLVLACALRNDDGKFAKMFSNNLAISVSLR